MIVAPPIWLLNTKSFARTEYSPAKQDTSYIDKHGNRMNWSYSKAKDLMNRELSTCMASKTVLGFRSQRGRN